MDQILIQVFLGLIKKLRVNNLKLTIRIPNPSLLSLLKIFTLKYLLTRIDMYYKIAFPISFLQLFPLRVNV